MKWRIAIMVAVLAAVALTVGVVMAVWTATQTASGTVNATVTGAPDLYLCEPDGPDCGQDDNGADEAIFEGVEDLLPSNFASDSLRLRNTGTQALDIVRAATTVTEAADPGGDCSLLPTVRIGVLVPGLPFPFSDNHSPQFAFNTGLQIFPQAVADPRYDSFFGQQAVHIAPGGHEDFQVQLLLPGNAPSACEQNAWNIAISWQVVTADHQGGVFGD